MDEAIDFQNPYANVPPCPFPTPLRHITTHAAGREAVFSPALPAPVQKHDAVPGFVFWNLFTTETCGAAQGREGNKGKPAEEHKEPALAEAMATGSDIAAYRLNHPAMRTISGSPHGSVFRILDLCPGAVAPMHRTVTIDYGIVLEGAVDAVLDSGETRRLERGSVCVQRGTMHAWKEATGKEWARMGFVLIGLGEKGIELAERERGSEKKEEAAVGAGDGETPEWKKKYDARNDGPGLKEWIPWAEGVPAEVMVQEVADAVGKGKGVE